MRETRVQFHTLSDAELKIYHQAFKGTDKAGGYSIQMGGSVIVKRMEGCFYNAMGLPLAALQIVLKENKNQFMGLFNFLRDWPMINWIIGQALTSLFPLFAAFPNRCQWPDTLRFAPRERRKSI